MCAKRRAAIVGAGPGGLAAAMLLSARGYEVTVYEKQREPGGRTSRFEKDGFAFDRGPTFLMMPHLLEELFAEAGRALSDYVTLVSLDPLYRLRFGSSDLDATGDRMRMKERIEALFPGNGEGYDRFMREEQMKFDRVSPLLRRPFAKWTDYIRMDVASALPRLHATDTVYGRLSRYYSDERLKYAFAFQAKYLGMSPWACPGTFSILSFMEHRYGLVHPIGGVNRVCAAMAEIIRENGGAVMTSCGVRRVLTRGRRACGLLLENGEKVEAEHIVINADFGTAMTRLFEPGILRKYTPERIAGKRYSCSAFMLYLGVEGSVSLPHHTILFSEDYPRNVRELTETGVLSEDPSMYVHNPSAADPTMAPRGHSSLYVLMPAPNLSGSIDWREQAASAEESVLDRLEKEPELRGLRRRIRFRETVTPLDWRDRFDVYRGATFNLAHSLDQMMHRRPHNRFEELDGCWLVGGGTHPGSGLPTIWESARISVRLLMEEDRRSGYAAGRDAQLRKEAATWT